MAVALPVGLPKQFKLTCVVETNSGGGRIANAALRLIAPAVVSPLPYKVEAFRVIAPAPSMVPIKTEEPPVVNAPFICQYTLDHLAPFFRIIFVLPSVDKAPSI